MARLRVPNQNKNYEALRRRLNQYSYMVQDIYDTLNAEAAKIVMATGYDGTREFSWSDYPATIKRVDELQDRFVRELNGVVYTSTSKEWKQSNLVQDLLASKAIKFYDVVSHGNKYQKLYYQTNLDALKAFQERVEKRMTLSDKVWNQSVEYRKELECAISAGVEKGMSAVTLSKRLSKYLTDFPTLQADYKERYGKAVDCLNCEYRSMRLARTESNMAYRMAEQARWRQFDFVLGYEIKLTQNGKHVTDICDELKGKYPKDFVFKGWHPNCMCYAVPILKTEEEFWDDSLGNANEVKEYPRGFVDWLVDNEEKIKDAEKSGTLPYFLTDNKSIYKAEIKKAKDFTITSDIVEDLRSKNFNRFHVDDYNHSAMRGFNLQKFDTTMEEIGDRYKLYWSGKTIRIYDNNNVSMRYKGRSYNADINDVELSRFFYKDGEQYIVTHELFELPEKLQGKGISKEIFRALFKQYENMGIDEVRVSADMSVGGYTWARYGFCAKTSEIKDLVKRQFEASKITKEEYGIVTEKLKEYGDIIPMNDLTALSFGKKMLLGTHWNGFLRQNDVERLKYLHNYIDLSK